MSADHRSIVHHYHPWIIVIVSHQWVRYHAIILLPSSIFSSFSLFSHRFIFFRHRYWFRIITFGASSLLVLLSSIITASHPSPLRIMVVGVLLPPLPSVCAVPWCSGWLLALTTDCRSCASFSSDLRCFLALGLLACASSVFCCAFKVVVCGGEACGVVLHVTAGFFYCYL